MVCFLDEGRDYSTKYATSNWVLGMVSSFRHIVGLSREDYEKELMALFATLEKDKGQNCSKTPSKSGGKFLRELKGLESLVNYDGKASVSRKYRRDGRELLKIK